MKIRILCALALGIVIVSGGVQSPDHVQTYSKGTVPGVTMPEIAPVTPNAIDSVDKGEASASTMVFSEMPSPEEVSLQLYELELSAEYVQDNEFFK